MGLVVVQFLEVQDNMVAGEDDRDRIDGFFREGYNMGIR